jgi:DNA-binding MurR/RpiR family transcriptional regulator
MSAMRAEGSWLTVLDEVSGVLSAVSRNQMSEAAQLLEDRQRRWFCCGQGRSGAVTLYYCGRRRFADRSPETSGRRSSP